MRAWLAFFKKECLESVRTGRLLTLGILFVLLGLMNPGIAKLTPWLFELLADELAEGGMTMTAVEVDALTSWTQFFKNLPVALIVFVLLLSKGLARYKVVLAKTVHMLLLWSAGYWLCFGVTYLYNDLYWDNGIALHIGAAAVFWWLFGVLTVSLMVLFSTCSRSSVGVLLGTGGTIMASYLIGLLPMCRELVPTTLTGGMILLTGTASPADWIGAALVAGILTAVCVGMSIPLMNKRQV